MNKYMVCLVLSWFNGAGFLCFDERMLHILLLSFHCIKYNLTVRIYKQKHWLYKLCTFLKLLCLVGMVVNQPYSLSSIHIFVL